MLLLIGGTVDGQVQAVGVNSPGKSSSVVINNGTIISHSHAGVCIDSTTGNIYINGGTFNTYVWLGYANRTAQLQLEIKIFLGILLIGGRSIPL